MTNVTTRPKAVQSQGEAPDAPRFDADRELAKLRQSVQDLEAERAALRQTVDTLTSERESMRESILNIDGYSSDAFGEIGAIAKLVLLAMERPMQSVDLERVARTLEGIWDRACTTSDLIHSVAVGLGAGYQDEAELRRIEARCSDR